MTKAETVRLLIEHGADVTMQDETYSTPLHLASSQGSAKTVQGLIEHGANVIAQDSSNRTPFAPCVFMGEYHNCITLNPAEG